MTDFSPASAEDIADIVKAAATNREPLEVLGNGTKRGIGRPMTTPHRLSTSRLSGITLYEPEELILSAKAGTPLSQIEALLADHNQQLAFEPPHHKSKNLSLSPLGGGGRGGGVPPQTKELQNTQRGHHDLEHFSKRRAPLTPALSPNYGGEGEIVAKAPPEQTIGGVIATGFSGPRRIQAGAIRDHLLGFTAVNGSGEIFKAGGRVVKNVTGYDLSKLMAGSFGTLAILSEVTLKVLPKPEARTTLIRRNQSARDAIKLLNKALGLPFDITGAAWSPNFNGTSITAMRLEGFADSVADRANTLFKLLEAEIAGADFDTFWEQTRDVSLLENATALWRVSVPPNRGADILEALPDAHALVDWGGGLIWLATNDENDCGASALRTAVKETGGHATLIRASDETRLRIAPFQSQSTALFALTTRVKESFDPLHILNPGRMYANL